MALRALRLSRRRGAVPRPILLRWCSSSSSSSPSPLAAVRNLGIMAHVDHGKTTTTEQMLVVSGVTSSAGLVDEGTTVMDHMDQERERGITIQAAAISFSHDERTTINLIDTPGHLDFTSEVERSARVLDGAVVVIDAVAGVQAQTITVWQQADRHNLSRIVFINKLDRTGASLEHVLELTVDPRAGR